MAHWLKARNSVERFRVRFLLTPKLFHTNEPTNGCHVETHVWAMWHPTICCSTMPCVNMLLVSVTVQSPYCHAATCHYVDVILVMSC
jgi:hypothetical protein